MGKMCPPQSVNTWPTPACSRTRATRSPPLRSAMSPRSLPARGEHRERRDDVLDHLIVMHRRLRLVQIGAVSKQLDHAIVGDGNEIRERGIPVGAGKARESEHPAPTDGRLE